MSYTLLATLCLLATSPGQTRLQPATPLYLNQSRLNQSTSPGGQWRFFMRAAKPGAEDDSPAMWLRRGQEKPVPLGELWRDAILYWCPKGDCLVLVMWGSIDNAVLRLYDLSGDGVRSVRDLDPEIRRDVRSRIGPKREITFYFLEIVGWLSNERMVVAAQAQHVPIPEGRPGEDTYEGFIVKLPGGIVERRLSEQELRERYGFSGSINPF